MERLDKLLAAALGLTRSEAKTVIKKGLVFVNGRCVKDSAFKADEKGDTIIAGGKTVEYKKYVYIMLNKPKGVISASEGKNEKTVIDILPENMKRNGLFPAGRLDKDTTGFMLITDDGDYAHRILSPKSHIPKTYVASLDKPFDSSVSQAFENGVELKDCICMPAEIHPDSGDCRRAVVTIRQGMYHQIKRMFKKFGITVTELERIKMGALMLDKNLKRGECRYLTAEEIKLIEKTV